MLRIHCIQQWFALGDEAIEDALYEIASMRLFAHLSLDGAIPDRTIIINFRHLLEKHKLARKILKAVNRWLSDSGILMKHSPLISALIHPRAVIEEFHMPYIITSTHNHPIYAYAFDPHEPEDQISSSLVSLESAEMGVTDKLQTTLIMTEATQSELANKCVPIFETKKEAKVFFKKLALSTCRYVKCVIDTPDARRNKTSLNNQMRMIISR